MSESEENSSDSRGFLSSVTRLVDQVVRFLITKLELFQIEVEEEWRRIATMLVLLVSAAIIGHLALISFTLMIAAIFWEHRGIVLLIITLIYGGAAVILALVLRHKLNTTRTKLFTTTLNELHKDREWLRKEP